MFKVGSEIILSEVSDLDSFVKLYTKTCDFIHQLSAYYRENNKLAEDHCSEMQTLLTKALKLNSVYEKIYEIVGGSIKIYFERLCIPDGTLIEKLNDSNDDGLISEIHKQLLMAPVNRLTNRTNNKLDERCVYQHINDVHEHKQFLLAHSLINLIGSKQFFQICELRKQALSEYVAYQETIRNLIEKAHLNFHEQTRNNFSFGGAEGFQILSGGVLQRFVRYQQLGTQLKVWSSRQAVVSSSSKTEQLEVSSPRRAGNKNKSSLKLILKVAAILENVGANYLILENTERTLLDRADLTKETQGKQPFDQMVKYRKKILNDKNELEAQLSSIRSNISNLDDSLRNNPPPKDRAAKSELLEGCRKQLKAVETLYDEYQEGWVYINKLIGDKTRENIELANEAKKNIGLCHTQASGLLKKIYERLKLSPISFARDLPKFSPYLCNDNVKSPQKKIDLKSSSDHISEKEPGSPEQRGRPRKNSLLSTFYTSVKNLTPLKKQSTIVEEKSNSLPLESISVVGSTHSSLLSALETAAKPSQGRIISSSPPSILSSSPERSEEASGKPSALLRAGDRYLKSIREEQANKVVISSFEAEKQHLHGIVESRLGIFEKLNKAEESGQNILDDVKLNTKRLDERCKELIANALSRRVETKDTKTVSFESTSPPKANIGVARSRSNTAPVMFSMRSQSTAVKSTLPTGIPPQSFTKG